MAHKKIVEKRHIKIPYASNSNLEYRIYKTIDVAIKREYRKGNISEYGFAKKYGISGNQAKNIFSTSVYIWYERLSGNNNDDYQQIKKVPTSNCKRIIEHMLEEIAYNKTMLLNKGFSLQDINWVCEIWARIVRQFNRMEIYPQNAIECNHLQWNELSSYIDIIKKGENKL